MFDRIDRPLLGVLIGLALLLTPAAAAQTTWYVDDDAPGDPGPGDPMISDPDEDGSAEHPFDAVQEGIDAATDGDTVLVADGTYTGVGNKNLDYDGKAVTVSGASGDPTMCIIDSENDGRGFYFHTGEGSDSIVEGMTITNGYVSSGSPGGRYGGGVCCMDGSSPTLTSCTISGNSAHYGGGVSCRDGSNPTLTNCRINGNSDDNFGFGGGVYCFNYSSPTLINCTISGNSASSGGGVLCWSSNPMITNCTISGNSASNGGGGVGCNSCSPTLTSCTISGNSANGFYDAGGGVYCDDSSPTLINCTISENSATGNHGGGGGVYCLDGSSPTLTSCTINGNLARYGGSVYCMDGSSPTLTSCTINGNLASDDGGGVYCRNNSSPTLTNCTISGNLAYDGGGVYCNVLSQPTLTNCTITGHSAVYGGGVYCDDSSPTLTNCIIWNDTPEEVYVYSGSPMVTYCNVQGGWTGEGNIDADPLFAFATDFHLLPGSPCIDAGANDPPGGLPPDDVDGNARPLDGDGDTVAIADMGVFEYNSAAPSIALNTAGLEFYAPEDGDDPLDQTLLLRNSGGGSLDWEVTGQPAWLTVSPTSGESSGEVDQVSLGVDISGLPHGAYAALLEVTDLQAVNSPREVLVTLYLSTTLYVPGEYNTIQAAIDAAIPGDVVEIADGTYVGAGNKNLDFGGKAMTVCGVSGDPTLCIIDCEGDGRGFYFHSGEGAGSIVEGLTITNGHSNIGGGVCCDWQSSPTLTNCTVSGNLADHGGGDGGGGIYCGRRSSPMLTNCTISGNSAAVEGGSSGTGGAVNCCFSNPTLVNCTISGNSADHGGGVLCWSSNPTLTNCTISGNSAYGDYYGGTGGGVLCYSSSPTLTNCTISGNSATGSYSYGGGVCCGGSSPTLINCTITGNLANDGGGVYCNYSSPTLTNCILWGDTPEEIYVESRTPVVAYCDVQGGWPGDGNIDADPLFVDPDGLDNDPNTWEDNDYHLLGDSPCIDAGDNDGVPEWVATDLDGRLRFADRIGTPDSGNPGAPGPPIVDMGAYEYQCGGDLDGDGEIGLADLATLLASYGTSTDATYADGDIDQDGDVDLSDLAALLAVYGTTCE